jgi:hypothetical protein
MSTMTQTQQLTQLKKEYMEMFECEQNGQSKFRLIHGDKKYYGNCALLILPYVTEHGFLNAEHEKTNLMKTLEHYKITNYMITYAQLNKSSSSSKKLIKQSRPLMTKLIEIINPKLIIVFDESSSLLFMTQKPNITEQHGTMITTYFNIPVLLTYNLDYYNKRTGYEDKTYKNNIFFNDWLTISTQYKELIYANI